MRNRQNEHHVPFGIDRKDDAPITESIPAPAGQFPRQQLDAVVPPWLPLQLCKAASQFLREGAIDCGKDSCASGDRMTSNIRADFPPAFPAADGDRPFSRLEPLLERRPIQEMHVISERGESICGKVIDDLFDLFAKFRCRHGWRFLKTNPE